MPGFTNNRPGAEQGRAGAPAPRASPSRTGGADSAVSIDPLSSAAADAAVSLGDALHLRRLGDETIVLDLARDAYLSAPAALFDDAVRACIDRSAALPAALAALSPSGNEGARRIWTLAHAGRSALATAPAAHADADDAVHVFAASARAALRLTALPLRSVVMHARARKPRLSAADAAPGRAAREAVRFHRWRPLFPRPYRCLFDSLALLDFLAMRGLAADWVFGVRMSPFSAHCWLQAGDTLLDADIEETRCRLPIMVV